MKIVIEGAGEIGSHLAKMLRAESNDITVIDNDSARLAHLSAYADVETVNGNPSSLNVLRDAGVARADLFIAVYPLATQEINIVGALLAKQLGARKVVARINDEDYLSAENKLLFKEMGIELMFYPEKIAADEVVSAMKHGATSETLEFAHGKLQISSFRVDEDSPLVDLTLGEFVNSMTPEENMLFRIIAVSRGDSTLIPKLADKFHFGDDVFIIYRKEGQESVFRHFGSDSVKVTSLMILGGSQIGEMVARSLASRAYSIKIVDKDKDRCVELSERLPDNVVVVHGDGRNSDLLFDEGIRDFDAFAALTGRDETNVLACVVAKKFGVQRTIAEVENIEYIRLAEEMGVDTVINKKLVTAGRIFKFTLSGTARFVKYISGTDAEVIEYTAQPGSAITKGALKDIKFPHNAIIGGVVRGNESFIAVGDTVVEPYDKVAIFALPQTIGEIDKFFK